MYTKAKILDRLRELNACETGWEAAKEIPSELLIEFVTKLETDIPGALTLAKGHEYEKLAPWLVGRWCPLHSLKGAVLKGLDLGRALLDNADLSGTDMEECYMFGTTLIHTKLAGANLRGIMGQSARFEHANLKGADLSNAYLRYARFNWSEVTSAKFICANLTGADFRNSWGRIEADFSKAIKIAMEG